MEERKSFIEQVFKHFEQLGTTTIELYQLKGYRKIAIVFASLMTAFFIGLTFFLLLCFLSVGLAVYIGKLIGMHLGFFIVGLGYGILGLFLAFVLRNAVKNNLCNWIIACLLPETKRPN